MKRFIQGIAIVIVTGIALMVFLYCNGFRITYAPDLKNSWDAISAFAAWAGVFMSLLAVIVAGLVAWKQNKISESQASIADKQNRIALFEKRLEIYDILWSCRVSVEKMKLIEENEEILGFLFVRLVKNFEEYHRFQNYARVYIIGCSEKLRCANFFFSEEIASDIIKVAVKLLALANADPKVEEPENYNEIKQNFFEAVENLDKNKILRSIEAETKMI